MQLLSLSSLRVQWRKLLRTRTGRRRIKFTVGAVAMSLLTVDLWWHHLAVREHNAHILGMQGGPSVLSPAPHHVLHHRRRVETMENNGDDANDGDTLAMLDEQLHFMLQDHVYGIDAIWERHLRRQAVQDAVVAAEAPIRGDERMNAGRGADDNEDDEFVPPFVRWITRAKRFLERNFTFMMDRDVKALKKELSAAIDSGDTEKAKYCAERLSYIVKSGLHPSLSREIKHFVYLSEYMDRPSFVLWELFPSTTHRASLAYEKTPHEMYEASAAFVGAIAGGIVGVMFASGEASHWVKKSRLLSRKTWYNPMGYRTKYILMIPAALITVAMVSGFISGISVFTLRSLVRAYYTSQAIAGSVFEDVQMHTGKAIGGLMSRNVNVRERKSQADGGFDCEHDSGKVCHSVDKEKRE